MNAFLKKYLKWILKDTWLEWCKHAAGHNTCKSQSLGAGTSRKLGGDKRELKSKRVVFYEVCCSLVRWIESVGFQSKFHRSRPWYKAPEENKLVRKKLPGEMMGKEERRRAEKLSFQKRSKSWSNPTGKLWNLSYMLESVFHLGFLVTHLNVKDCLLPVEREAPRDF